MAGGGSIWGWWRVWFGAGGGFGFGLVAGRFGAGGGSSFVENYYYLKNTIEIFSNLCYTENKHKTIENGKDKALKEA